ncbi:hypothetical protein FIBSPDRAFT_856416 [Athelia psychrophila]|uniref:CoA-dependent acyltransferase n=1 Tax=Athelia psychrophila TaxID=1759441 RepID=A0A166NI93_9AGAM|nr:hypothetical protein FIBSPDRAFT_856416 [Fibularhizoctonia sp. CBS 109695]
MATPWSWTSGCAFNDTGISDPSRTWNRTFWGCELLFARAALATPGRADLITACDVKFPAVITATHVRAAMRALRFSHPSIASTLVWSSDYSQGRFQYQAPTSEEEVDRWLDAVVIHRNDLACPGAGEVVDAINVLSSELSHAKALRTKDLLKLYHLTPSATAPDTHGFLMYLNHSLFDGVGGWQALDCFLHELCIILSRCSNGEPAEAAFEWGNEHTRLARPVSDRAFKPWTPADLHTDWPMVKRMNKVLSRPSVGQFHLIC